ncbi:MAG: tetratricopeptide repeat protein [Nitrospiraceae bacterium]|nr:tetratricopeptide repeat protein [Nitrospiraceae bacterium]
MAKIKKRAPKVDVNPEVEIKSIAHNVSDFYMQYQKQLNLALTIAAVVLIGWGLFALVKGNNEKKAGLILESAYAYYKPVNGTPDLGKALAGFQEVVKQYGSTMNGAIAQYYTGITLSDLGRSDDALKAFDEFTKRYSGEKFLLGRVYQRMGYVYINMDKRDEAIKAFTKADEIMGAGPATLELAKIYDRMGKTEDAQKRYKELAEDLPATTYALEARTKLNPPDIKAPVSKPAGTAGK